MHVQTQYVWSTRSPRLRWARRVRRWVQREIPYFGVKAMTLASVVVVGLLVARW